MKCVFGLFYCGCTNTSKLSQIIPFSSHKKHSRISQIIPNVTKNGKAYMNQLVIMPVFSNRGKLVARVEIWRRLGKKNDEYVAPKEIPLNNGVEGIITCEIPLNLVLTNPIPPYEIIWANQTWCTLYEYEQAEVKGQTFDSLQWSLREDHVI